MPDTVPAGDPRRVDPRPDEAPEDLSDPELINATRAGDTTAYAVLYERHVHSARRLARILAGDPASADDLVSETFAKLLHTFREGGGPDLAFRPYMLRTLRNTFYDRLRRDKRVEFTDDLTPHDTGEIFVDPAVEGQERRYAVLAFGKLPERWRMVLWHTEVEEDSPAQIASMLGMTANGVSALAYRAREKLRQNYLTEHAADSPPEECRWTVDRIGARVRGKLAVREAEKVDEHLEGCVSCNLLFAELTELNSGLRGHHIAAVYLGAAAVPYLSAGAASAAGFAVGGAAAAVLAPFKAAFDWVRRLFQQLGTKGSIATGTAAAVIAAAAIFVLTSGESEDEPQAADPPAVAEPEAPAPEPDDEPADDEPEPEPEPDPDSPEPDPDEPNEPAPDDEDEPEPEPDEPNAYQIQHGLGSRGLAAGGEGVLPIRLQAPESGGAYVPSSGQAAGAEPVVEAAPAAHHPQAASNRITLDITVPDGVTLAAEDAAPGWRCDGSGDLISCTIPRMPDPAEADVRVNLADGLSGYQTFSVTVSGPDVSGTTVLRIPVAPSGSIVGYASLDATGVTAAGNTLLTCAIPGCRDGAEVGIGDRYPMKAYKAPDGHPQPPAGQEGEAVSGANLDVPAGAEVLWAGLYWAGVHDDLPGEVALAGPGGSWTDLSASQIRDTSPGAQAFVDVTGLVGAGGTYWVAADNHQLPTSKCHQWPPDDKHHCMEPHWAGWSLTVVYAEPGAEPREVAVYDGAPAASTAIEVNGGGEVTVAHTLWGGSAYSGGDSLAIGPHGMGEPATCRAQGAVNNPRWYTFGVDIATNSATLDGDDAIRFERGGDQFIVGVVAVAAPGG